MFASLTSSPSEDAAAEEDADEEGSKCAYLRVAALAACMTEPSSSACRLAPPSPCTLPETDPSRSLLAAAEDKDEEEGGAAPRKRSRKRCLYCCRSAAALVFMESRLRSISAKTRSAARRGCCTVCGGCGCGCAWPLPEAAAALGSLALLLLGPAMAAPSMLMGMTNEDDAMSGDDANDCCCCCWEGCAVVAGCGDA